MRLDLFEAERDQRQDGVVEFLFVRREGAPGAGGLPCAGHPDFVFQFHDDPLRGFFADTGDLRQRLDVGACHRAAEGRDADAAEDIQGDLRADAAHGMDQQTEQVALLGRHESVKGVRILAHDQLGQQPHRLPGLRQLVVGGKRDQRFVADAVHLQDHVRGERFNQFAVEESDHVP